MPFENMIRSHSQTVYSRYTRILWLYRCKNIYHLLRIIRLAILPHFFLRRMVVDILNRLHLAFSLKGLLVSLLRCRPK